MLYHPDWNGSFEIHTDASKHGCGACCGAMLAQWYQGKLRPVKFASRSFNAMESRWPTTHQELFAVKWSLDQHRPYVLGRRIKIITDHTNLKWLTSISPKQSKLTRWCISMAEFDFEIEHRSGKDHVVPDTLSRAPIPEPSTVGDNLVIPPAPVDSFLIMALGLDIPFIDPSSVSEVFNDALQCITLSCSPTNPNRFSSRNSKLLNTSPSVHISTTIPDTPPPIPPPLQVQSHPDVTPEWSSDLDTLHPLNISRTNFAQKQCQETWLGPLFQYLIEEENVSVLTNLLKNVSSWVRTTASNCKIIDGILMYRDKLMENPDHYRIFVPSDPHLQHHFLHAYKDSLMGMHRGHDATYNALSGDFYWRNLSKHVHNWVRRCQHCIHFKSLQPAHGPIHVRLYQHLFHTLGVDYVGELPCFTKW